MFDEETPVTTTLKPGPNWGNTFDPATHRSPVQSLDKARAHAHRLARPYFLWDGRVCVAVSEHQHLETGLGVNDVEMPAGADGRSG